MLRFEPLEYDNSRILLIDGDILVYRASALSEGATSPSLSFDVVAGMMQRFQADMQTTEYVIMFSDSTTFRHYLYPDYKSNRKAPKPSFYEVVKQYTVKNYFCTRWPYVEADDAIVSEAAILIDGGELTPIIVSLDKDLKQVPNTFFYNLVTGAVEAITREAAYTNLFLQCLTGDAVDHIGGIKGVGKKKAEKLIANHCITNHDELYAAVLEVYLLYGYTERDAQAVFDCVVMQRNLPSISLSGWGVHGLTCENFQYDADQGDFNGYVYEGRIPNLPI